VGLRERTSPLLPSLRNGPLQRPSCLTPGLPPGLPRRPSPSAFSIGLPSSCTPFPLARGLGPLRRGAAEPGRPNSCIAPVSVHSTLTYAVKRVTAEPWGGRAPKCSSRRFSASQARRAKYRISCGLRESRGIGTGAAIPHPTRDRARPPVWTLGGNLDERLGTVAGFRRVSRDVFPLFNSDLGGESEPVARFSGGLSSGAPGTIPLF